MPPKVQFDKIKVANAAYNIVRRDGLEALSARSVAHELGASPGPVYRLFNSMQGLMEDVVAKAIDLLIEYTEKSRSKKPLVNISSGLVLFSQAEPRLFALLFLTPEQTTSAKLYNYFFKQMSNDETAQKLPENYRIRLTENMGTHALGMAMRLRLQPGHVADDNMIVEEMRKAGRAFYNDIIREIKKTN